MMKKQVLATLPWLLCVLSVLLGVLSLLFMLYNSQHSQVPIDEYWGAGIALVVLFPLVGALIASRHASNPIGWIMCLGGLASAMGWFTHQYVTHALIVAPGSLPFVTAVAWFGSLFEVTWAATLVFLLLLFPDGRPVSLRWHPLLWLAAMGIAMATISFALQPGPFDAYPAIINPLGIEQAGRFFEWLAIGGLVLSQASRDG